MLPKVHLYSRHPGPANVVVFRDDVRLIAWRVGVVGLREMEIGKPVHAVT
jgi:hypothetical protein